MEALTTQHWHLAWMIPAVLAIFYLGSPRFGGRLAQRQVKRLLTVSLDPRRFTQFHELVLPAGGGTEALDHVLVSRHGVFVVVSENRPGQLSGGESQELWKQERLGRTRRWPNPVYRAKLQIETLERLLDIPRNRFRLLVTIGGQEKPLRDLPRQVMTIDRLVPHLQSQSEQLLSPEQADRIVKTISDSRLSLKPRFGRAAIARLLLGLSVVTGIYLVYGDDLRSLLTNFDDRVERWANPHRFHETGERKTEEELFEESLICAFSSDTMRCSCYEKDGEKVEVGPQRCRELAERGSILKQ